MQKITQYGLSLNVDIQNLEIPKGGEIVKSIILDSSIQLFVLADVDAEKEEVVFEILKNGESIAYEGTYVETFYSPTNRTDRETIHLFKL